MRSNFFKVIGLALLIFFGKSAFPQSAFRLANGGQLVLSGPTNFVLQGGTGLTLQSGALITNNGTINIAGGGTIANNGTYRGSGIFAGTLFDNTGGIVSPGLSPGCTIFGAGYTNGTGTELIEIGGVTPCTLHDQLQVTGTATLSGTLDVQLFGGFIPTCGQSFTIMTSTTLVGTFATINYPVLPAGLSWSIQYNAPNPGDVTLLIVGTPTATATPASQTVCSATPITTIVLSGSPIAGTTYNWTRDNPIITGIANSGSGDISGTLTNPTNIPVTVTFTITPTSPCGAGVPITATVTVNPTPDVNAVANQVVCNGAPTTAVNFTGSVTTPPGTVFNWTNSDPSIGLAVSGTGNIPTFVGTNPGTAPISGIITVTPSYTNGGGGPVTQTFNYAGSIVNWTVPAGVTSINISANGAQGANATGNGLRNGGRGAIMSGDFAVTPGETLSLLVGQQPNTIVNGGGGGGGGTFVWKNTGNVLLVAAGGGGGSVSYGFQPPAGLDASITTSGTAGTFNSNPGVVAPGGSGGNGGGALWEGSGGAGWLTNGTNGTGFCSITLGGTRPLAGGAGGAGTSSPGGFGGGGGGGLCWFSSGGGGGFSGGAGSGGNEGSGGGGGSFNGGTNQTNTAGIQTGNGQINISYSTSTTCTGTPITFTYTVNPTPTVNPIANRVRCYGDVLGPINFSSPTTGGSIVYNWTNNAPSIGIPASGSGNIPNRRVLNTSNIPVVATITVTPAYTNGGTTCNGTPMTFTITVNPTPNFNNATLFIPGTLTLADPVYNRPEPYLQGGACVLAVNPGEGTAVHYKTHTFTLAAPSNVTVSLLNSDGGNVTPIGRGQDLDPSLQLIGPGGFVPGAACTNSIAHNDDAGFLPNVRLPRIVTTTPLAAGTYTVVVTTWDNTPGALALNDVPLPWNYTLAVHTTSQTVCNGAPTAPLNFTTTVPGTVFDWTNNDPSIGLAASGSGSIASFTATNATTAPVTATITVSPTYTNAGVTCSGAPILYYITVNPTPTATATPASQTVCSATPITPIVITGNAVAGVVYNWTRDNVATVTGIAASGAGDISGTLTNTTNAPITVTFTITPTANGCPGTPITATVTVNPTPDVNQPANQVVCNGAPTTPVTFTGAVAGTIFNWTNSDPTIGLAASGTGNIASFNAINMGTAPVVATVTVTPTYSGGSGAASRILLAFAENSGPTTTLLINQLLAVPGVTQVDFLNTTSTTPSLAQLQAYDVVVALTNSAPANSVLLGDNLADYIDGGGKVVATTFAWTPNFAAITGRWLSGGYAPFIGSTNVYSTSNLGAYIPGHPLMQGVTALTAYYRSTESLAPGATQVAAWADATPLMAVKGNAVGLSAYIGDAGGWSGDFARVIVNAGGPAGPTCTGTPITFTYTVNPTPNATATPASQTICSGAAITNIALTGTVPGTVFNWTRDNGIVTGIAASGSGTPISGTLTNPTNLPITVTFTITPTYTNAGVTCTGTPITATVLVNPTPTVNAVANQVVCNGAPTTAVVFTGAVTNPPGTVYTWTNNTPSIGLAAGPLTGNIASFTAINTGTAPVTATITVTPSYTNGGVTCTGTPTTFTITVNPTATVIVPANAFVCNGTVQATGTYNFSTTATGGVTTYSWTNNDISIGLGASGSGNSLPMFTATNPTNVPITGTITVTPTFTNGGVSCVGTSNSFSITVNPTPNATATPASQTICSAGTITTIVNTGTVVGTVFNWTRDNNVTATGIAASGVGNISGSLTNTTNGPVLVTFTITPSYTNGGTTCFGTPVTATVLVNPLAVVNPVANQIVCNGDLTAPVVFTSPTTGGAIVYNWTNNTTSIGLAASGTGNIAAFTAINNGTAPVTATITVTPTYTNGGISCVGTPTSFTITVNPTPQVDQPANQVVCNGAPTAPVIFTTPTTGSVRFNWVNNTTSIGLAASGTGNIPSFIATNVTNAPVVATVTVTPIGINTIVPVSASTTMGSGFGTSLVNTINGIGLSAFPSLTATHGGTLPGDSWVSLAPTTSGTVTFNLGGSFNVSGFSFWNQNGGGPGASGSTGIKDVQILSSTDGITFAPVSGAPTVFAQVAGASGLAPEVFNFASVNATHIRFAIANNYGDAQTGFGEVVFSGNECVGPTKTFTITVNPTPTVNPVANQIVCAGSPTAPVNFTGFVPGTVYNWTNNNPNIGLTNSGSGNIPSFIAVNVGTAPDLATIVVTPSYTNAGVTCTGTPISFTITVNPQGQVNQPASQAVCNGAPTAPVNFTSTVPGTVFSWTNNTTSIGLAASGTGNIPSFIGTNATNAPVVATIVVTPSFTNAGVTCTGPSKTFTITVNPTPVVNAVASQVVCNGAPTANINFTSPTTGGTVVYNWTNNTASIGLPASGTGDILSFIATNPTNAPVTANLTVTMSYSNGGVTCTSAPVSFTITVNPTPQVNQPANQVVCAGTPTAPVNFSSPTTGGSIVYNWTNNQPSIGLAGSGTGNIASFIAINATAFPIVATINVTPVYTNAGTTCTGPFKTFTITVNPIPVVAQVTDKFYCNGATTQLISFSGTVGSTYSWTNSNPGIGLAASGTGDILPFVTTNATNGPITGIITVSPVLAGCPGVPMIFTITVNPTPVVNPVVSQVLCNGSLTAIINFTSPTTGPTGALSFAWTNSAPSIGLAANGTGNIAPFVAVNTGLSPVIALITVTPVYNNGGITCTGATQTFTITVNPTPTVNAVANQVLCVGSATAAVNFTGSVFGTIYNWTNSNPGIGLAAAGAGNIASFTTINAGTTPQVATITVTPNFTNGVTCPGTPITFTITVNPIPSVTPVANQVVCAGSTVTQTFAGPVAGTVYNWTNSNTAIGLAASGSGNLNFVSTNATGAPLTATITVTPTYTNAGGSCSGASTTFTITVNPIPTVNAVLPQVLCNGSATAAVNFTGLVAGTVYNWTNTNTSIGLAASGSGNIASFTATNATAVVQVATITVTPTFTNGGTTCTGTAITFTITVNPTPAVNAIANQVVCNGTATAAVTITGPSAPTTYNWSNNNISIGLAASGTNTIPSFVGINTGSTPVTATITITPVFTNGGISCPGPTSSFTITVNPTAVVNQPADQLVCNGSNTAAVVFSGLPPGSTYSWTNSNTSIGLAASGTGNIASFVATNATAVVQTATITVTPSSTGCGGTVVSFTITVNPTPVVNAIANQVVCARSSTAAVTISGPVAGTVYTWTNSNTTIGLGASGTGNIPSFVTINPTNAAITATITVTPTYTNGGVSCTGNPVSFTITVNPLPNIVFNVPPRVCLTDTLVTLKVSPAGGTWSGRGVSGSTFSASAAGVGAHVLSYTVSNALGCTTTSYVTVTVNDCIERHNVFATAIRLYPNPSSGRFNIRFLSDIYTTFKVRVVNDRGQQLGNPVTYSNVRYGDVIPMNLTNLPSATYWLEIYNDNERAHFPFVIVR